MAKNNLTFLWIAVAIIVIALFSGVIKLGSLTNPSNQYDFTWKNYSISCTSNVGSVSFQQGDTDFSDGIYSINSDPNYHAYSASDSGSVVANNNLAVSVAGSSSGYGSPLSSISCAINNLDLSNAQEVDIYMTGSYSCSGVRTSGGGYDMSCGLNVFGLGSSKTTRDSVQDSFSDIKAVKDSQGNWIVHDLSGNSGVGSNTISFSTSLNGARGGGSSSIIIYGINIIYPTSVTKDCRQLGCSIGICQTDGTCLVTNTETNISTVYIYQNNTLVIDHYINNTVYVPIYNTVYQNNTNTVIQNVSACPYNIDKFPTVFGQKADCQNGTLYIGVAILIGLFIILMLRKR